MEKLAPPLKANPIHTDSWKKAVWLILPILALGSLLLAYKISLTQQTITKQTPVELLSTQTLEERDGLKVYLIGVTAAGGLVDFRVMITDAEKARLLLQDKANFPVLKIGDSGTILQVSADSQAQELNLESGGIIQLMYPNVNNIVKPGTPITVVFGNTYLEPIPAK